MEQFRHAPGRWPHPTAAHAVPWIRIGRVAAGQAPDTADSRFSVLIGEGSKALFPLELRGACADVFDPVKHPSETASLLGRGPAEPGEGGCFEPWRLQML